MKNSRLMIVGLSVILTGCQIHYRDLTPPEQPNWQNTFNSSTLENVEVWPYKTPREELLYVTTEDVLKDYAENMGYHFYLEIQPDRGISNINPFVIINGERHSMEHVHGTTGGVWFHRELAQTTCDGNDYAYYYEINFKRWGYSSTQVARLYSAEDPAHSVITLDDIIGVAAQHMKPDINSFYVMRSGFPSGSPQEIKVILSNRTDRDVYYKEHRIEDHTAGYAGSSAEYLVTEHPAYYPPNAIECGTYRYFRIRWSPLVYLSPSDVPPDKTRSVITLWITSEFQVDGITHQEHSPVVLYGLYQ